MNKSDLTAKITALRASIANKTDVHANEYQRIQQQLAELGEEKTALADPSLPVLQAGARRAALDAAIQMLRRRVEAWNEGEGCSATPFDCKLAVEFAFNARAALQHMVKGIVLRRVTALHNGCCAAGDMAAVAATLACSDQEICGIAQACGYDGRPGSVSNKVGNIAFLIYDKETFAPFTESLRSVNLGILEDLHHRRVAARSMEMEPDRETFWLKECLSMVLKIADRVLELIPDDFEFPAASVPPFVLNRRVAPQPDRQCRASRQSGIPC